VTERWRIPPADIDPSREMDRRLRRPLVNFFFRRVLDRTEAEDLTQEAFARLSRHPDMARSTGAAAYVFVIAANLLKDRARARAARKTADHRSLGDLPDSAFIDPGLVERRDPERVLMGRERLSEIIGALGELGERTRDIFILSRLENLSHREIAAAFGISVSAVEKHIMKAMAYLGARFLAP